MKLFTPFKPMALKSSNQIPVGPNHLFQIKWDGIRGLVHVDKNGVKVFNRNLYDKTNQYPELQELQKWQQELILDGEIIVLRNGLPNFSRVIKRDFAVNKQKITSLMKTLPIIYCIFDILHFQGEDLLNVPLQKRLEFIERLKSNKKLDFIFFTEHISNGKELYELTREKNIEGIVAKVIDSSYERGLKTGKWLKIKHRREQHCIICGYTMKELRPSALVLGAYNEMGQLVYIGRAGSGLSGHEWATLAKATETIKIDEPPIINPPKDHLKYIWLEPRITLLVEYLEWTDNLSLRAPVIKGFTKFPLEECKI